MGRGRGALEEARGERGDEGMGMGCWGEDGVVGTGLEHPLRAGWLIPLETQRSFPKEKK